MTPERIERLVRAAERQGVARLDYVFGNTSLRLTFSAGQASKRGGSSGAWAPRSSVVTSPGVGFLRLRHPLGGELPKTGDAVRCRHIVAFLQSGPLLRPVIAPADGVLGAWLCEADAAVDFGAPLLVLGE